MEQSFIEYLNVVDDLLQTVYGITSNDTGMELIESCHEAGEYPEECVQQIANKNELESIVQFMEYPYA